MASSAREVLAGITTVGDMILAFQDEDRCRRLLEAMVWPRGRICPACGYRRSTALAGRDLGRQARLGLYQCSPNLIDETSGVAAPFASYLETVLALIAKDADALDCVREVEAARAIVVAGTSADRQLAVLAEARGRGLAQREALGAVVDWLAATTAGPSLDG